MPRRHKDTMMAGRDTIFGFRMQAVNFLILLFITSLIMFTSCTSPNSSRETNGPKFSWEIAGTLPDRPSSVPSPGVAGAVVGISHNRLIIAGGSNFPDGAPWDGGKKVYQDKVYLFKKENDSLLYMDAEFHLPYPVAYSANVSTDEGIIAIGGENENGALNKVMLINWDSAGQKPVITYLPDLPLSLTDGAVTVYDHKLYFAGGQNADEVSNKFLSLNLKDTAAGWQALPDLPERVTHTSLLLQNNGKDTCIYLVGGRKRIIDSASDLFNEVYQFDLKTNQWTQKTSLPYSLSAQTGVSWGDSSLLIFSGDQGKTFHATELLLMQIAREKCPAKKNELINEKNNLQKHHPGYNGNVLLYNTHTDAWIKTDSIPFPGQVTTTAVKWNDEIIIPCGEIRAGVRTPEIILGKVIF